jgi:hemerythrin-like domain-containing protein
MTAILGILSNDHRNMSRVLDALERQIGSLAHETAPDYSLLRNILEYLLDYPTRIHHPVEDLVYGELKLRNPAIAGTLDKLEQEHADIETQTRKLALIVDRALQEENHGDELDRQRLAQAVRDLIGRLRRHLSVEEMTLFPAARNGLTSADWADIALVLGAPNDPLFGPRLQEFYRCLHREILISEAAGSDPLGRTVHQALFNCAR